MSSKNKKAWNEIIFIGIIVSFIIFAFVVNSMYINGLERKVQQLQSDKETCLEENDDLLWSLNNTPAYQRWARNCRRGDLFDHDYTLDYIGEEHIDIKVDNDLTVRFYNVTCKELKENSKKE